MGAAIVNAPGLEPAFAPGAAEPLAGAEKKNKRLGSTIIRAMTDERLGFVKIKLT
jgi:hypothetical protein